MTCCSEPRDHPVYYGTCLFSDTDIDRFVYSIHPQIPTRNPDRYTKRHRLTNYPVPNRTTCKLSSCLPNEKSYHGRVIFHL